ncbi:Uncharacterised protein [Cedecea neteri]|uniref:AraC-like ligand binding domain n=1 Tax=Cedecea neteri TaxID=158822 RepID=A0A2X3JHA8_9ENTR|nr:Uncharacterised protein [Cedecea neteri]
MERDLDLEGFDPDSIVTPALAFRIRAAQTYNEKPIHTHRKGQLILALHGGITSEVTNSMWMVPPQYAVWVPGQMPHSNRVTADARLCFLFIEPDAIAMPQECCALKISPLVRELILRLSNVAMNILAARPFNGWFRCCLMNFPISRLSSSSCLSPHTQKYVR